MKTKNLRLLFNIVLVLFLGLTTKIKAQEKVDVITTLDGQTKEGKVINIGTDSIKFIYSGEDLEYDIKKSNINKIVFSSGRTEIFNKKVSESETMNNKIDSRNKIAVLPFEFITNDPGIMVGSMTHKAQEDCINSIKGNTTATLKVQEAIETNALLAKNNISDDQLRAIIPSEMAKILGVEYVLYGTIDVVNKGTFSSGSEVTTYNNKKSGDKDNKKNKGTEISSGSSSTTVNYDSKINLNIINDQGTSVYSDSKNAFGSGIEAYHSSLNYLIKRTPFGTKAKH